MGANGYYERGGAEIAFTISVMSGEQDRIDIAQAAAQQIRAIGINCTVEIPAQMDWGGQMACLIGWGSPFDADDHTYKVFGTDKGANYSGYSNAAVDSYLKLARETEVDGFFWDEPHYAYPKSYASITGGAGDDWACRCPECMKKFEDYYGYEMPKFMNDDVKQFRWREALETLSRVSKSLKEYNPKLEITCCVHATLNGYYVTELRGYDNWDMVAACPYFDVFSTTIINWSLPDSFFQEITDRTVAVAKKYGKESERWLMGYNKRPEKWEQIDHVVDTYEAAGVDRLATWTYRGGYGTSVAAKDALELWDNIGRNYKRVLQK